MCETHTVLACKLPQIHIYLQRGGDSVFWQMKANASVQWADKMTLQKCFYYGNSYVIGGSRNLICIVSDLASGQLQPGFPKSTNTLQLFHNSINVAKTDWAEIYIIKPSITFLGQ